jgi:amino acid adenylation domain-containing protein/non-ribosomal peptide synthase protein (TIGR01720 family)
MHKVDQTIAVIGLAGIFPEAGSVIAFWNNMKEGKISVRKVSAERIRHSNLDPGSLYKPYAHLDRVDLFDHAFFGISKGEAEAMDPQQRLFLQEAWHALEDAGYAGERLFTTKLGIFTPHTESIYGNLVPDGPAPQAIVGNKGSMFAARLSFFLDSFGPVIAVATECSSGLAALHLACQSLNNGECEIAIVGGANLILDPAKVEEADALQITSADGQCYAFDQRACGTTFGEGCGVVILKKYSAAISDDDHVRARIIGSCLNHDGRSGSLTSPNPKAQEALIDDLLRRYDIDPATITYIESHGTGTKLGDPIEIKAITRAFRQFTPERQYCAITSLKPNIGHLNHACGIAGLIRTTLALQHAQLPPAANFDIPNPLINFADSPVYVNRRLSAWPGISPRRAMVSSFGTSGTNVAVLVEEVQMPARNTAAEETGNRSFILSARTLSSLSDLVDGYIYFLTADCSFSLGDICYTLEVGRLKFAFTLAIACKTIPELIAKLQRLQKEGLHPDKPYGEDITLTENDERSFLQLKKEYKERHTHLPNERKPAGAGRKAPLPGYAFERTRCWFAPPLSSLEADINGWYYELNWIKDRRPEVVPGRRPKVWLIVEAEPRSGDQLAAQLKESGDTSRVINGGRIGIIDGDDFQPDGIICLMGQGSGKEEEIRLPFQVTETFGHLLEKKNFQFVLVTTNGHTFPPRGVDASPWRSCGFALAKSLLSDHVQCDVRGIDLDKTMDPKETAACILQEVHGRPQVNFCLYHGAQRYIQRIEKVDRHKRPSPVNDGVKEGLYIVTGGLSGIGLEVSRSLVEKKVSAILLIGRTPIPGGEGAAALRELQGGGSRIDYYGINLGDRDALEAVLADMEMRYGSIRIAGIFHAAGVSGRFMDKDQRNWAGLKATMEAKVQGTVLLDVCTRDKAPGFMVLFSSINSLIPRRHSMDYAVANYFLDEYSRHRNQQGYRTISINWPDWRDTGMGYRANGHREVPGVEGLPSIRKMDGIRALYDCLSLSPEQVIIAQTDTHFFRVNPFFAVEASTPANDFPSTAADSVAPVGNILSDGANETEHLIADIWAEVLKLARISRDDDFFEKGGHSLNGIQVINRIREKTRIDLEMDDLFESPRLKALAGRLMERMGGPADPCRVVSVDPLPPADHYAVSHAQKRLLVFDSFGEASYVYNLFNPFVIEGPLDIAALEEAFMMLIRRHEILRTSFVIMDGEPRQRIHGHETIRFKLTVIDMSGCDEHAPAVREEAFREARSPFDLQRAPLIRATVIKLAGQGHLLLYTVHHIAADGWSLKIIRNEILEFYREIKQGRTGTRQPLRVQYKDYSAWQNSLLSGDRYATHRDFFKQRLGGELPLLELPSDVPRPKIKTYESRRVEFELDKAVAGQLYQMTQGSETSLFMVLMSSVYALLYRYTHQQDILIGTPVATRELRELEDQIGHYLNTLVFRIAIDPEDGFDKLLAKVKEYALQVYEHQAYPFDRLVYDLRVARDTSHSTLFDVMVVLQNFGSVSANSQLPDDWKIREYPLEFSINKFDLTWYFFEQDGSINVALDYNTSVFPDAGVERMVVHYKNLLSSVLRDPDVALERHDYLTEEEKRRLVFDFNDTVRSYSRYKTLHRLLEEQTAINPHGIALKMDGEEMTYALLNSQANRLAGLLIAKGVTSRDRIGLLTVRGFDMIVGMYAILKTGAAYVPIDPGYPDDRREYIIANSGIRYVLIDAFVQRPQETPAELIPISRNDPGAWPDTNPDLDIDPAGLAYIIYTSGSTGRPKGVMIEHHSAVNLIEWVNDSFAVGRDDRLLFVTSMCFDLSVYDIFGTLACGATLVIVRQDDVQNFETLREILVRERITFWDSVPSTMNFLVSELGSDKRELRQRDLRVVFLSGDWIPLNLPDKIRQHFPGARVISLGGATEGTVWSNYFPVTDIRPEWKSIPYGKPIANNYFYILDPALNPVPQGVVGELYIGGAGVARGYMNEKEKTGYAFVTDPFHQGPGGRMYRTGDLGRMMADGNMEFLGRRDQQVKIRGYRVELGEIEQALLRHPRIKECLATVKGDRYAGKKSIVAYLIADTELAEKDLHTFLSRILPEYMIPQYWVRMDRFPVNVNGKIDRKALPDPVEKGPGTAAEYLAPANETERLLTTLWEKVLGREPISVQANFFELGGDSINAMQISSRARALGYRTDIRDIYQHPTLRQLAHHVGAIAEEIHQGKIVGISPLTPIQRAFFGQRQPEPHHYNQALILQSADRLDPDMIRAVFSRIREHHDALRTTFQFDHGEVVQMVHDIDQPLAFEIADLRDGGDEEALFDEKVRQVQSGIRLEEGPLAKLALCRLSDCDRLLIVIHHLVVDAVSWRILTEDMDTLFIQYENKEPLQLPLKTDACKTWAERLIQWAKSPAFLGEIPYWMRQSLEAIPFAADALPRPGIENRLCDTAILSRELGKEQTHRLLTTVNRFFGADTREILLTALALGWYASFGRRKLWVAVEGHGREEAVGCNVNRTVGWFTAIYPLLLEVIPEATMRQHVNSTKEAVRSIPHQGIGFGVLTHLCPEEYKIGWGPAEKPVMSFNYLGQFTDGFGQTSISFADHSQSPLNRREFALDVLAVTRSEKLTITIAFDAAGYSESRMQSLLDNVEYALVQITDETADPQIAPAAALVPGFNSLSTEELNTLFE